MQTEKNETNMQEDTRKYMEELRSWLKETADVSLEEMAEFFKNRLEGYEEHMSIWKEAYIRMAEYVSQYASAGHPDSSMRLLDLGCGTGLELDQIFAYCPRCEITGIDLSDAMLDRLAEKHPDKELNLICADYFQYPFKQESYDMIISVESLHHFKPEKKFGLYQKLYKALSAGGIFLEADYLACCEEEETLLFDECARRRAAAGIPEERFVHFDTPLTAEHELELLKKAGFEQAEVLECVSGASFIRATK